MGSMDESIKKRLVITGIGVVAPNGIGKEHFWDNGFAGISGIKPITLFDASRYRCRYAGEISDFQPEQYLGSKGLRTLDRTTLLALVAAKLAIDDAKLEITDETRNDIGVVLGSTMGSVHSISEFDRVGLQEGPRYVNPAHFPNAVINSPASQVAIRFGLRGLNSTISTGFTASLDAIGYAMDMLTLGRVKTLLVGGVEELCLETFLGFYKLGFLATSQDGRLPSYGPFDPNRCGALLGEGSVFIVLELLEDAQARSATMYAELSGYGTGFHPASLYRCDPQAQGAIAAVHRALDEAGVMPENIDYISACANSTKLGDAMELTAIHAVFGSHAATRPLVAVKSLLGESFSASAAFQLAETVGSLVRQHVPLSSMTWPQAEDPLPSSVATLTQQHIETALIESFGPTGVSSALVIKSVHRMN